MLTIRIKHCAKHFTKTIISYSHHNSEVGDINFIFSHYRRNDYRSERLLDFIRMTQPMERERQ